MLAQKVSKRNRRAAAAAAAEHVKHACRDKVSSDSDHHRVEDSDNDDIELSFGQPVDTTLVNLCYPIYSVT